MGVWDPIEWVSISPDGEREERLGSDPNGLFVYTPQGKLILHATTNPLPWLRSRHRRVRRIEPVPVSWTSWRLNQAAMLVICSRTSAGVLWPCRSMSQPPL